MGRRIVPTRCCGSYAGYRDGKCKACGAQLNICVIPNCGHVVDGPEETCRPCKTAYDAGWERARRDGVRGRELLSTWEVLSTVTSWRCGDCPAHRETAGGDAEYQDMVRREARDHAQVHGHSVELQLDQIVEIQG